MSKRGLVLGMVVAAVAALFVSSAAASSGRAVVLLPLAQLRGAAAQYAPGAVLPNKLPPRVTQADVGAFCNAPGVGGPPCRWMLTYTPKSPGVEAFHLGIYQGRVANKVVKALLRHDGKAGSTAPFRAGRYTGTRERQRDARYKVGWVDSYVWQTGKWTYLLEMHYRESGAPDYPGTNPKTIIASFGASGPSVPLPPAPVYVTVPNLVGMTKDAATAALKALGLVPASIRVPARHPSRSVSSSTRGRLPVRRCGRAPPSTSTWPGKQRAERVEGGGTCRGRRRGLRAT